MSLTIHVNTDDSTQDLPLNSSGVEWTEFSEGNDRLLFTAGSPTVDDGETIPTQAELISAGVQLTGSEITVDTYFMEDLSENELRNILLMGDVDAQFVIAFDFDDVTASEPTFEVWDDANLDTITGTMLGGGTPSSSFIRGITTTSGPSGASWASTGTRMAGSGSGNFLFLNDESGALTGAATLYATLAVIVPASQTTGFSANPVFVVKWLSN